MNTLAEPRFKRRRRTVDPITADELVPKPDELVLQYGMPDTITGWKALANGLLTNQSCVFHRNVEISARYAWIYKHLPACFKWAGMAAFASHHVRVALYPFRLDTDRTGYADIPRSLRRQRALLMQDVDTIRATNNAIFDDIFWVHLAYCAADDGIEHLRACWQRSATMPPSFPASRRSTRGAVCWRTGRRPRRIDGQRKISSGRATSSSSNTSSAPWCNHTSIAFRAHSPGSSRWARSRASKCGECGRRFPTSPRSTFPRSNEACRKFGVQTRGRG